MVMLGSTALIIWGSVTLVAMILSLIARTGMREKVTITALCSSVAAGASGGFTVNTATGLFVSAGMLFMVAWLLGYEG